MTKHLSFWLGVFAAALITVPIAAGIMGVAEQELRRIAVVIFVFVAGLVVALVVALVFRDWILRKLFGRAEATLDDVGASLIEGVAAATAGDREAATAHARALVQRGMGWYAWTNFYRWVIATAVALLLAFGAFMGTVLLFEQNRKLGEQTEVLRAQTERLAEQTGFMAAQTELMQAQTERLREQTEAAAMQNEIMSLNLVNELRDQMLATIETRPLGDWLRSLGVTGTEQPVVEFAENRRSCALGLNLEHPLHSQASQAALGAIEDLTKTPVLGDRVISALNLLVQDRNGGVALGAAQVLDRIGQPYLKDDVRLNNLMLSEFVVLNDPDYNITLSGSYSHNMHCANCNVHLAGSVLWQQSSHRLSGYGNLVIGQGFGDPLNGLTAVHESRDVPEEWNSISLSAGPYLRGIYRAWLTDIRMSDLRASQVCPKLQDFARLNPLLKMLRIQ